MFLFLGLGLSIAIVICVIVVAIRLTLKKKEEELSERIATLTPFSRKQESGKRDLNRFYIDIETDLRNSFNNHVIAFSEEERFTRYYEEAFSEVCSFQKRLEMFSIKPSERIKAFKKSMVEYFIDYPIDETEWEQQRKERREKLSEQKSAKLKAMFPDMDGKVIYVRSEQEQKICFVLSSLGVKFRYEEQYKYSLSDEMHSQYHPDFSIYFEHNGVIKRIYLEHFGVDEHGLVPVWFATDKNMTYEEACKKYNDGITWKKAAHKKFGTQLLITSSADFHYSDIRHKLRKLLSDAGVPIQEKTDEELYGLVLPKGSKQEKAFIRLVSTFVTLVKSSCKSIEEIVRKAEEDNDERSVFIQEYISACI